jgi:predicted phage terminase large subunit-like protein
MKPGTRQQYIEIYKKIIADNDIPAQRDLCRRDVFFLLVFACRRADCNNEWVYARCREVEDRPDECLDLWAREHYKSTIITFGLSLQDILKDPEITIGIFSHTRPIAKSFLSQLKRELETNEYLQRLFPDVLYANPTKESPRWSLDDGIIVRRKDNPKEATVEAWGLVDGQPVSKHYKIMVYDDVVTRESVSTPEMIMKVTEAWALSLNLAGQNSRKRYIGTRYHANDTYATMIEREAAKVRLYPATDDGTLTGKPVFLTQQQFDERKRIMGSYVAASQLLMNPLADHVMGLKKEWLEYYDVLRNSAAWNVYILVDPASEKKKSSDYTVIVVIGLGVDNNYYLLDGIRDRLNLTERTSALFDKVRQWKPKTVGYEKYGLQSDIEHIKYVQQQEGFRFNILELGGTMGKNDRIRRLVPAFEQHRFYFPRRLLYSTYDGKTADFVQALVNEEYVNFPVASHDDILDAMARITDEDLMAKFPTVSQQIPLSVPVTQKESYDPYRNLGTRAVARV